MKPADSGAWNRTSPYAILFFLGRIIRHVTRNAWQSLAPLFAFLIAYQGDLASKLMLGGIGLGTALLVGSVLHWLFFRYRIGTDSILIRSGIVRKKQLDIKFDRIQGVNTTQNLVYRALGLVTVTFDTAGSSANEGQLPAVTREFAYELRTHISSGKSSAATSGENEVALPGNALLKLDWRDMFRIGLADRRALLIFAFIGPLMDQRSDEFEAFINNTLQSPALDAMQLDVATGAIMVSGVFILLAALLVLISVAAAFLRYHNFELFLDGRTLRSQGGLFTRNEHTMDLEKIQTLQLQQGIVQIWLNRFLMTVRQAISGRKQRSSKLFVIPVVTIETADMLRRLLLAPDAGRLTQNPRSKLFQPISPYYMRSRILFLGLLPGTLLCSALYPAIGIASLTGLIWLPIVGLFCWRNWKRAGYLHNNNELVRRSGLLGFRTVGLLFRKVQRVTITQSRYQRRKNLASLKLYMASGSVRVPYIEHEKAKQLRNYILYKVESSQQAWH